MRLRAIAIIAILGLLSGAAPGRAADADWSAVADVGKIDVLTTQEDGTPRETVIWLAVVDGQGYIRTSRSSRWGGDIERSPDIALRIDGQEYPVRAEFVTDEALRDRIAKAFSTKYGWSDGFIGIIRGSNPRMIRVLSR